MTWFLNIKKWFLNNDKSFINIKKSFINIKKSFINIWKCTFCPLWPSRNFNKNKHIEDNWERMEKAVLIFILGWTCICSNLQNKCFLFIFCDPHIARKYASQKVPQEWGLVTKEMCPGGLGLYKIGQKASTLTLTYPRPSG